MITRADVANLRPGDVVEVTDQFLCTTRGPLRDGGSRGFLLLGAFCVVRYPDGDPARPDWSLTVISRAPRPLYVNHDRTEPVPGDVIRGTEVPGVEPGTWTYTFSGWVSTRSGKWLCQPPIPARLLVDGDTGQVVP